MKKLLVFVIPLLLVTLGYWWGQTDGSSSDSFPALIGSANAQVAQSPDDELLVSPTEARERDTYYPNSESLKPDEMRVITCGTGMPTTRAAQAAACFLVELGNGDKFLFDIGSALQNASARCRFLTISSTRFLSATSTPITSGGCTISSSAARSWGGTFRFAFGAPVVRCPNWARNTRWTA